MYHQLPISAVLHVQVYIYVCVCPCVTGATLSSYLSLFGAVSCYVASLLVRAVAGSKCFPLPATCVVVIPVQCCIYTVEPPLKETLNKGNLSIMNRITCPKTSLSYSANTFITSEERKPLYNEQNNLSQSYVFQRFHCIQSPSHCVSWQLYSLPPT